MARTRARACPCYRPGRVGVPLSDGREHCPRPGGSFLNWRACKEAPRENTGIVQFLDRP